MYHRTGIDITVWYGFVRVDLTRDFSRAEGLTTATFEEKEKKNLSAGLFIRDTTK